MNNKLHKPELLCPAGSPAALDAALESGADAVYLGGSAFNARMHAHNFSREDLSAGIRRAHALGASVYLTMNTAVSDRELPAFLDAARDAEADGVDALIIADLGAARAVHRILPHLPLHASTQMSGHNIAMGELLARYGFSRMVLARETPAADLRAFCADAPIESEVFLHGALCVSHSGQCLFSSVVGGRSGNRGECAQPCRLPYCDTLGKQNSYPLSLRDLCLAAEIPALAEMGVTSLKIEGRMKSPEYVRDVVSIYRRLLDERRAADRDELEALAAIFSRGGFTSGYFHRQIDGRMLGVRSEGDKALSRTAEPFTGLTRRAPLSLSFTARAGEAISLTLGSEKGSVTVTGEPPLPAENAPTSSEIVRRQLGKLGGTVYAAEEIRVEVEDGLMIPIARLNALRRAGIEALDRLYAAPLLFRPAVSEGVYTPIDAKTAAGPLRSARFSHPSQITPLSRKYFDRIYLPLFLYDGSVSGVILPPVCFDHEREAAWAALCRAAEIAAGGRLDILCTNLGQIALAEELRARYPACEIALQGDFRLNVWNRESAEFLHGLGLGSLILSPELTPPQMRDICGESEVIAYGRLPLMLLEKCVNLKKGGASPLCAACTSARKKGDPPPVWTLTDRKGVAFPVLPEWEHRSVVYNSLPIYMADRLGLLEKHRLSRMHFLFSVESPAEVDAVITAYKTKKPPAGQVRRM